MQTEVSVANTDILLFWHHLLTFESDDLGPQVNETVTKKATDEGGLDISEDFSDLFLRSVSLFYLKLEGQFLLPAPTIESIVEEMQNIHDFCRIYSLSKLASLLKIKLHCQCL